MKPRETVCRGLRELAERHPLVHHMTNMVVMNFTANVTLCLGAAPVMAPCVDEAPEMVRYAGSLLLNIGTLDPELIESMIAAGRVANEMGIPIVLDPVGAGATRLRTESARRITRELEISIVRGNAGEILALAGEDGKVRGVDSMDSLGDRTEIVSDFASSSGWVIALTGISDIVTDGDRTVRIDNGHPLMGMVTGTGCAATTSVACFAAAMDDPFEAALTGISVMGVCGELAAEASSGPGTFVPCFLDALHHIDENVLSKRLKAEILA